MKRTTMIGFALAAALSAGPGERRRSSPGR